MQDGVRQRTSEFAHCTDGHKSSAWTRTETRYWAFSHWERELYNALYQLTELQEEWMYSKHALLVAFHLVLLCRL